MEVKIAIVRSLYSNLIRLSVLYLYLKICGTVKIFRSLQLFQESICEKFLFCKNFL